MKGAIGNAFLMNIVITFILIFFSLLIGSMAYSKAYKTKNFLLDAVVNFEEQYGSIGKINAGNLYLNKWRDMVNPYLQKVGYNLSSKARACPDKIESGYYMVKDTWVGDYEYCIYNRQNNVSQESSIISYEKTYMVLVYMKFDFPIIGDFIKIPITGETKTFTYLK